MSSVLLKNSTLIPRGVGHSLIWPWRACTAEQVMVFIACEQALLFGQAKRASYGYGFQGVQSCKQGLQFQYLASTELCSSAAVVPQSKSTEM